MSDSPLEQTFERQASGILTTTVGDLREAGWEIVQVKGTVSAEVPSSIQRFNPDLVARRGDELVIFEVKSRNSAGLDDLDGLAKAVAEVPNARLEVYWLGDEPADWPSRDKVRAYARDALELLGAGHAIGAVATAWAAVEAALVHYVADLQISIPPEIERKRMAWQIITYLDSLGYISERDFAVFDELRKQRNAVMHFAGSDEPDTAVIEAALDIVDRMLGSRYVSLDRMIEWFIKYHDFPDVPVQDAERARIQVLLAEQFPGARGRDITDAVSAIVHDAAL
jgi:hypothetical protein